MGDCRRDSVVGGGRRDPRGLARGLRRAAGTTPRSGEKRANRYATIGDSEIGVSDVGDGGAMLHLLASYVSKRAI